MGIETDRRAEYAKSVFKVGRKVDEGLIFERAERDLRGAAAQVERGRRRIVGRRPVGARSWNNKKNQ